jgi:tetratricopeptide (TPR) repeat protein
MSNSSANTGDGGSEPQPFSSLLGAAAVPSSDDPPMPSSRPLQIFLLIALVVTGAAYVVNEWTELTTERVRAKYPSRVRELVKSRSLFVEHTDAGKKARERKRPDQAVSEFRQALQAQDCADGHQNLAVALMQSSNPDAGFAQFREAVRLDPKFMAAYAAWGEALAGQGKFEEAVKLYKTALENNPDSGIVHYNLANTLQEMGRVALAARREAAAEGKSDDATADQEQSKKLAAEALQHYTKASRTGVDSPAFWTSYGELLNDEGRFSDAEAALNRAFSAGPDQPKAHFQLARTETELGKYADAIGQYEKVLTLTPDSPDVLNNLALLYVTATNSELRSPKMAVQLATRACDATTSQNARFMDTLARAYAADGDFFQAITWEDKAIKRAQQLRDDELARELTPRYQRYVGHKAD